MDVEVPGAFQEQNSSMELSTPIKKIKNLRLDSPGATSPIYPKLDEIYSPSHIMDSMIDKGYSQRLTNTVLNELNMRANEISKLIKSPTSQEPCNNATIRRNKRYSGIHRSRFNNMESISSHYAAKRSSNGKDPQNTKHDSIKVLDTLLKRSENVIEKKPTENDLGKRDAYLDISSVTKRRKTLNGPEEVLNLNPFKPAVPNQPLSSPIKKLSPSKKSFNLNKLLKEGDDNGVFLKPVAPSKKLRTSSLELAGVKLPQRDIQSRENPSPILSKKQYTPEIHKQSSIPQLQKKSSIPQLQKKPSVSQLQTKNPSSQQQSFSSTNQLYKKSSIPQLLKKPSIPQLQKKSSIPQLQKKPSISNLQKKQSISNLQNKTSDLFTKKDATRNDHSNENFRTSSSHAMDIDEDYQNVFREPSRRQLLLQFSSKSNQAFPKFGSSKSISGLKSNTEKLGTQIPLSTSHKFTNVTIPEPFSLYNKPTISSSQKSLNRFQKFKEKFH